MYDQTTPLNSKPNLHYIPNTKDDDAMTLHRSKHNLPQILIITISSQSFASTIFSCMTHNNDLIRVVSPLARSFSLSYASKNVSFTRRTFIDEQRTKSKALLRSESEAKRRNINKDRPKLYIHVYYFANRFPYLEVSVCKVKLGDPFKC